MNEQPPSIMQYEPLFGSWHVVEEIGQGNFGTVYRVSKEEMGQRYDSAVKLISIPTKDQYREAELSVGTDPGTLGSYFEDIVRNIVGEVNVLHSLSGNTNIVAYLDHAVKKRGEVGWDLLIRMEFVTSLRKYQLENRLTREQAVRLGIDICTALEVCGKKGIIHRDIKDDNIFINADGVFKLGDFGIARELSKSGRAASMRGTPLYMAPEVYRGEKYDVSVDICSLGLVLYRLLNRGRMPFMPPWPEKVLFGQSDEALDRRMRGESMPLPMMAGERLGGIILKACAYRPEDRYRMASVLKRDLEDALSSMDAAERSELVTPLPATRQTGTEEAALAGTVIIGTEERQPSKAIFAQTKPETDKTMGLFGQNVGMVNHSGFSGEGQPQPQTEPVMVGKDKPAEAEQSVQPANESPIASVKKHTQFGGGWWISGAAVAVVAAVFILIILKMPQGMSDAALIITVAPSANQTAEGLTQTAASKTTLYTSKAATPTDTLSGNTADLFHTPVVSPSPTQEPAANPTEPPQTPAPNPVNVSSAKPSALSGAKPSPTPRPTLAPTAKQTYEPTPKQTDTIKPATTSSPSPAPTPTPTPSPTPCPFDLPMVSTGQGVVKGSTKAELRGSVTSTGGNVKCEAGFYYGTSSTNLDMKVTYSSLIRPPGNNFQMTIYSLEPNTKYYFRVYAANEAGESVGKVDFFTTWE